MSNACYFEMKIAGEEPAAREFAKMLEDGGFGQVTAFELDGNGEERDPHENGLYPSCHVYFVLL